MIEFARNNKQLINKFETINVGNLPPVYNLTIGGKKAEQLSREQLIVALYVFARQIAALKAQRAL